MSGSIDRSEVPAIHCCIALRGGERSVAQQLLNCPKVSPSGQEMSRKGMAERMGSSRIRQSQVAPQQLYLCLNGPGSQRAPANCPEQRPVRFEVVGTSLPVATDTLDDHRQQRYLTLFLPLASDKQHFLVRGGRFGGRQRERLADAQATAIKQQQNGGIPFPDPLALVQCRNGA